MAWFHPELYRRVLAYSPTLVNQQWPHAPWLRGGAWEYHSAWTGPAGIDVEVGTGGAPPRGGAIPGGPAPPRGAGALRRSPKPRNRGEPARRARRGDRPG